MARPPAYQSLYWNPPAAGEDELVGAAAEAPTNDNGTLFYTTAMSRISTPALALLLAPIKLMAKYTNADLQRATKLALKLVV